MKRLCEFCGFAPGTRSGGAGSQSRISLTQNPSARSFWFAAAERGSRGEEEGSLGAYSPPYHLPLPPHPPVTSSLGTDGHIFPFYLLELESSNSKGHICPPTVLLAGPDGFGSSSPYLSSSFRGPGWLTATEGTGSTLKMTKMVNLQGTWRHAGVFYIGSVTLGQCTLDCARSPPLAHGILARLFPA